jgi:cysteine synthase A
MRAAFRLSHHSWWGRAAAAAAAAAASAAAAAASAASSSPSSSSSSTDPRPAPLYPAPGDRSTSTSDGLIGSIGNTPLLELKSLSAATGCRILAKAEHMNPGGSVKDRPAAYIILEAEREGRLVPSPPGGPQQQQTIIEGTGGNTGVGMALVASARGYRTLFTMPANIAPEKVETARGFGAEVVVCPVVPFSDPRHFYHTAKRLAEETPGAVWGNQFEGLANMRSHYLGTAPEIWRQSGGRVDGVVCAAGTGGTIAGLSTYLRERNPALRVYLIDPPGSSLAGYVETGRMEPVAGTTITEGIGVGRLTANFASARIDGAFRGTDQEAVEMAYYLLRREGVFVGPSAALNVVGAVKLARKLGPGHTVVTVLCDGGDRYRSKLYNPKWMEEKGFVLTADYGRDHADFVA